MQYFSQPKAREGRGGTWSYGHAQCPMCQTKSFGWWCRLEPCQVGTQVIKKKKAKCHGKCQFKFGPKFSCDIHAYKSRAWDLVYIFCFFLLFFLLLDFPWKQGSHYSQLVYKGRWVGLWRSKYYTLHLAAQTKWWEGNLVVTSLVWRKGHGLLRRTRNWWIFSSHMANAVGAQSPSSLASGAAARAAASGGLTTSGLTWKEASLMKLRSNLSLTSIPVLAIGSLLFFLCYTFLLLLSPTIL